MMIARIAEADKPKKVGKTVNDEEEKMSFDLEELFDDIDELSKKINEKV